MTALERREEILHILIKRKEEKLDNLAIIFGVSKTTIRNDIDCMSMAYPIYTIRGNGGGIFIDKNYHPYKMSISRAQKKQARHTFATRCIEAEIPPIVLKKWMGHTNIHVTLDTYADVFDKLHNFAVDKLDAFFDSL